MVLDPQGIARVCRWQGERGGFPDWSLVAEAVGQHGADVPGLKKLLRGLAEPVRALPASMRAEGVPMAVIEALDERTARVAASLAEVR
jgi:hypothetical protein